MIPVPALIVVLYVPKEPTDWSIEPNGFSEMSCVLMFNEAPNEAAPLVDDPTPR